MSYMCERGGLRVRRRAACTSHGRRHPLSRKEDRMTPFDPRGEAWRTVWRQALAPRLPTPALEALGRALAGDAPDLLQGATTHPPPGDGPDREPVAAACALAYGGWRGVGL